MAEVLHGGRGPGVETLLLWPGEQDGRRYGTSAARRWREWLADAWQQCRAEGAASVCRRRSSHAVPARRRGRPGVQRRTRRALLAARCAGGEAGQSDAGDAGRTVTVAQQGRCSVPERVSTSSSSSSSSLAGQARFPQIPQSSLAWPVRSSALGAPRHSPTRSSEKRAEHAARQFTPSAAFSRTQDVLFYAISIAPTEADECRAGSSRPTAPLHAEAGRRPWHPHQHRLQGLIERRRGSATPFPTPFRRLLNAAKHPTRCEPCNVCTFCPASPLLRHVARRQDCDAQVASFSAVATCVPLSILDAIQHNQSAESLNHFSLMSEAAFRQSFFPSHHLRRAGPGQPARSIRRSNRWFDAWTTSISLDVADGLKPTPSHAYCSGVRGDVAQRLPPVTLVPCAAITYMTWCWLLLIC